MATFYDLSETAQILFMAAQFIATCMGICMVPMVYQKRRWLPKLILPIGFLISGGMLAIFSANIRVQKQNLPMPAVTKWASELPIWISILLLVAIFGYMVFLLVRERLYRKSTITRFSMKEGLDSLSSGLCFYEPSGRIILSNNCMQELCHKLVGRDLQNAALFWELLQKGEAGADVVYEASFKNLTYSENGKINGIVYEKDGEEIAVSCRLVADCSGIPAVVRRSLPDDYGIEKFELTPKDIFYVTLRYIDFEEKRAERYLRSDFWLYFKAWLAPSGGSDALIGMGACGGFDVVEKVYSLFEKTVKLPAHTVTRIEKGRTPYHRAPYSFVSDGFIAMGDAACLTKPNCGEGCTAALALTDIAVDVATKVMANGAYPTREALWSINKRYNDTQGKEFASLMALLGSIIRHSAKANEYLFKKDVIFSCKLLSSMGNGIQLDFADYAKTLIFVVVGLVTGRIKPAELKAVIDAIVTSGKLTAHYEKYPETPAGYEAWAKEAELLWAKTGKVAEWDAVENF